jgi:hypothetical protein
MPPSAQTPGIAAPEQQEIIMDTSTTPTNAANQDSAVQATQDSVSLGSRDGDGAADHDELYDFGRRPTARMTFPFSERQYARLLALRGRARDDSSAADRLEA